MKKKYNSLRVYFWILVAILSVTYLMWWAIPRERTFSIGGSSISLTYSAFDYAKPAIFQNTKSIHIRHWGCWSESPTLILQLGIDKTYGDFASSTDAYALKHQLMRTNKTININGTTFEVFDGARDVSIYDASSESAGPVPYRGPLVYVYFGKDKMSSIEVTRFACGYGKDTEDEINTMVNSIKLIQA